MVAKLRKRFFLLHIFLFSAYALVAQSGELYELKWTSPIEYSLEGQEKSQLLNFNEAQFDFEKNSLPYYFTEVYLNNSSFLKKASIKNAIVEVLTEEERKLVSDYEIPNELELEVVNTTIRKQNHSYVKISPFRKNSFGEIEKLLAFELDLESGLARTSQRTKTRTFANESKMKDGDWYKIAVTKDAVYKLSYSFLKNLGLSLEEIDPRNIQLFGYGGGMLPKLNSEDRPDDMQENAIVVSGEQDGVFNKSDYILFYGEDQVVWTYDNVREIFRHELNIYEDSTFYFLHVGSSPGKRIAKENRPNELPDYTTNDFNEFAYHEEERTNLIRSGQLWVGELFDTKLNFTFNFNIPSINTNEGAKIELSVLARSGVRSSFFTTVNGQRFETELGSTNLNRYEFNFATTSRSFFDFNPGQGVLSVNLQYNKPQAVSKGWLNSITVNLRRNLIYQSEQLLFRDAKALGNNFSEYLIQTPKAIKVWDITSKANIVEKEVLKNANQNSILASSQVLREFIAFDSYDTSNVHIKGRVVNQNLHGMALSDLVIISHPLFFNEARRLADFHREEGMTVAVVSPQQIYNEFSSGAQDLVAIRSFLKMFYDRSTSSKDLIKYAIMFGDASYDFKDRVSGNTNFVPAYQATNSLDPVNSYVSDDYFALLDDDEGVWKDNTENLDIAIGRFPVQTIKEASGVVDKIINYSTPRNLKDWRNDIVFVADDEDGNIHMAQANDLSKIVESKGKDFNTKKIFLDAYQQQSTASGDRYPGVNEAINSAVQNGALILNYTGHGGETGWTAERVLTIADISSWKNSNNLPVFVTATCEFSRFDDPFRVSGGELVLLNPNGGGIGLMTTTRLVFSSPNYLLNRTFYERMFNRNADGSIKRLGDIFREVKNVNAYSSNSRNFSLLGDPAIRLAIPDYNVITTTVNGKPVSQADTLNALSKVTVTGYVEDNNGLKLTNYNGFIFPTVFDKVAEKKTLNNDGSGTFSFQERDRRLFKGKASVVNGEFEFSFVVPKDISYSFGNGKISYYTENGLVDGNGFNNEIIVGGSNPNVEDDKTGPEMVLYMNDESFVYGGITDNSPVLKVELSDSLGINTVGSGIGHDLVAVLDGNTENSYVLNDYYEAAVDDFSKGKISFPFENIAEGKHTLSVKAWDVANNSSEKTIEFNVVESKEVKIDNLVNYPNPFTTSTEFIFQHNQAGTPMDVKLEIFTVSGKLVKSFNQVVVNDGFISRDIKWNGRDDFGDRIGKGVYVYKIKVRSRNGSTTEKFEKLVIL